MKKLVVALLLALPFIAAGQTAPPAAAPLPDPFKALSFLVQNWEANTNGYGGVKSIGTYTFRPELGGHVLARRSTSDVACKGPASFDCEHHDVLYVYEEAPGQPLKAIYFDNEGHVIHYDVSTPTPTSVVFLSEASRPGPQFRLSYELKDSLLLGKFQMQMPGQTEWKSYLEWSGPKK
jgi:hypothetical protein